MDLRPLPEQVEMLLHRLGAPPLLVAHLTLVHEMGCALIARVDAQWPALSYDRESVRLGAAIHDIGKIVHPEELTRPGHQHENAGEALLRAEGFADGLARLARTHSQGASLAKPPLEDLLVALADRWWRGKRDEPLESAICQHIAQHTNEAPWQVFLALDESAAALTSEADARLAWLRQFSLSL